MKSRGQCVSAVVSVVVAVLLVTPGLPARTDPDDRRGRETGPEDGILCCLGTPFIFQGDHVLVLTGRAGIFRSEHRGDDWQRSMEGLVGPNGVSPTAVFACQAPSEPRIVYATTGLGFSFTPFDGLFSSTDFGKTWTRRAAVPGFGSVDCSVDPDDARTVYVTSNNDDFTSLLLWKSTDGGRTVRQIILPFTLQGATAAHGFVYAVSDTALYASTDGGAHFHLLPIPPGIVSRFAVNRADDRRLFVGMFDDVSQQITYYRSSDGGVSYTTISGTSSFGGFAFDPSNSSRVYFNNGELSVSNDGGLHFARVPLPSDPRFGPGGVGGIGVDPRGSVYLAMAGGPFRTDDGGRTYQSLLNGFRASSVQDLAIDANGRLLVGVTHTRTLFRQTHGRNFEPIGDRPAVTVDGFNSDAASVAASTTDADVLLMATAGEGFFRTINGGRSWTSAVIAGMPDAFQIRNSRMVLAGARAYLAVPQAFPSSASGLYRSLDGGQSFASVSTLPFGAVAADPTNPDVVYVGTYIGDAGLFKSTDAGQTLQSLGQKGTFSALAVDHRSPQVVYAGERFGQVMRSTNGGQSFAPASAGLVGAGVHGIVQDARGRLFVWLRGGGLFASDDGTTWHPVDTGEALRRSGVEAGRGALVLDPRRPGRLYLGSAGVIQIDVDDEHDQNNRER